MKEPPAPRAPGPNHRNIQVARTQVYRRFKSVTDKTLHSQPHLQVLGPRQGPPGGHWGGMGERWRWRRREGSGPTLWGEGTVTGREGGSAARHFPRRKRCRIFPRCGPRYKGRHRPAAARSTTRDAFGAGSPEPSPCCDGKTLLSPHPHLQGATWPRRAGGSLTPRLRMWGVGSRKPIRSQGQREPGSWMPGSLASLG